MDSPREVEALAVFVPTTRIGSARNMLAEAFRGECPIESVHFSVPLGIIFIFFPHLRFIVRVFVQLIITWRFLRDRNGGEDEPSDPGRERK